MGQTKSHAFADVHVCGSGDAGYPVAQTEGALNLDFAVTGGTCALGASFPRGAHSEPDVYAGGAGMRKRRAAAGESSGRHGGDGVFVGDRPRGRTSRCCREELAPGTEISIGGGFAQPVGVAVDGAGNTYVADNGAGTSVKKVPAIGTTANCVVTLATK